MKQHEELFGCVFLKRISINTRNKNSTNSYIIKMRIHSFQPQAPLEKN